MEGVVMSKPIKHCMLTTVDNPFDPFTQFKEWQAYDSQKGHHTLALLARIVVTSDEISEADQALAIELAIDDIIREINSEFYRKVSKTMQSS